MPVSDIKLTIQTADQTRKAQISVPEGTTTSEVLQAAIDNWALPLETEYSVANISNGQALVPTQSLSNNLVSEGDVLEIQPVLVAG